jgi:hypothetical protein
MKKRLKQICHWQIACKEDFVKGVQKSWTCCAHLHEGRVFDCKALSRAECSSRMDFELYQKV